MSEREATIDGGFELVAVGDICFGDSAQTVGSGVHSRFERFLDVKDAYPFENTGSLFQRAAMVFGNLETVLSHRNIDRRRVSSMEMRGHPGGADRLARAGFTVLNVANNHMMQHGSGAFSDTVNLLRRRGLTVVGVADSDHRACIPQTVVINGLTVAILGFAFEPDKYAKEPVAYAFAPDCDVVGQVTAAKKNADLVICSVHWGVEFIRYPSCEEQELGHRLVDAGADLVIGHHPHVARRVERYRRGLIAYSLGNFVFDMLWNPWLRTGLVLRVLLSGKGIERYTTELIWIGDDYQPRPMSEKQRAEAQSDFEAIQSSPAWVSDSAHYAHRYDELVKRNRYESYRHFLVNMNRRPVRYTLQTLLRTARRKGSALVGSGRNSPAIVTDV